jgi:hypothetical protein
MFPKKAFVKIITCVLGMDSVSLVIVTLSVFVEQPVTLTCTLELVICSFCDDLGKTD